MGAPSFPIGYDDDEGGGGGSALERQMLFDEKTRDACWKKMALLVGRDPERWPLDAADNVVTRGLWGADGVLGYMFDHIVPVSRGGQPTVDNCQVLQTMVYKSKPDNGWKDPAREMRGNSPRLKFTDKELDEIEIQLYMGLNTPGKQCRIWKVGEMLGLLKPMDNIPPCPEKASKQV